MILFSQYGSVLAESSRSNLRVSAQLILTRLQDELLFTMEFGHELNDDLSDSYAPLSGWDYDTTPATLIINEIAIDASRGDDSRNIIRRELSSCADSSTTSNPVAINNVIYFIEDIPGSDYDRLVKRVITPDYDICSVDLNSGEPCSPTTNSCRGNAKQTTCPEVNVGTGGCVQADSILSDNVISFDVIYYTQDNVVTNFPSAANRVDVTLSLGDKIFGKNIEVEARHGIRKVN